VADNRSHLDTILQRAIARAESPTVRKWLKDLLKRGEYATEPITPRHQDAMPAKKDRSRANIHLSGN
jgi:hypothetical protein